MQTSTVAIKELREKTGAGVLDCRNALTETQGDLEKALQLLKAKGLATAAKKASRPVGQGLIEAYVHPGGRLGAMVEVNCETDFVARTEVFKQLAHDLVLQVAATGPRYLSPEEIPAGEEVDPQEVCLLSQPFIRDLQKNVADIVTEAVARTGENIRVRRFARFELGN